MFPAIAAQFIKLFRPPHQFIRWSFVSIERVLLKEAAQYDYKDVVDKRFLISEGTSIYYKADVTDIAPISRWVHAMFPQKITGTYKTIPFHFQDLDLGSVKITRNGAPAFATPTGELQPCPGLFHYYEGKIGSKLLSARLAKVLNFLIRSLTTGLCNAREHVANSGEIRQR